MYYSPKYILDIMKSLLLLVLFVQLILMCLQWWKYSVKILILQKKMSCDSYINIYDIITLLMLMHQFVIIILLLYQVEVEVVLTTLYTVR